MQRFGILTKTQIEKVHETSLQILEQIGVDFSYPPALEVLKKGGAKVDGERVFFPPKLIEGQIKKAPNRFTLYARNPENNVVIGDRHMVFTSGYGAPFVTDLYNGRRNATLFDFENFVIDDEMCGMVNRIQRGFEVNTDTLALDIIKNVGPGGHFLDKDHTFDHFRTEFYQPSLSNRDDFETWQASGSPQSMEAANKKYKEILESYEVPELPADVDKDLLKFIEA